MRTHVFSLLPGASTLPSAEPASPGGDTLVLAFGGASLSQNDAAFATLRAAYPNAHLIGCSTAGEIVGDSVRDGTLSGAVVHFDRTRLHTATAHVRNADDSYDAGEAIAKQLEDPSLRAVFILSDGLHVNGSDLVRGLNAILPPQVVVTGGLAGDGDRFASTWVKKWRADVQAHLGVALLKQVGRVRAAGIPVTNKMYLEPAKHLRAAVDGYPPDDPKRVFSARLAGTAFADAGDSTRACESMSTIGDQVSSIDMTFMTMWGCFK